jgi:hypothetical protein
VFLSSVWVEGPHCARARADANPLTKREPGSSCICAYLMEVEGYTFHEALNYVRINRPVANPNEGFRKQLELFEQVGEAWRVLSCLAERG